MVLLSAGDPDVRNIIIKVTNQHIIPGLAAVIGGSNAEERALQVLVLSCGFIFGTRLLPVGPGDSPLMQEWLRTSLQAVIDRPAAAGPKASLGQCAHLAAENERLRHLVVDLMLARAESDNESNSSEGS